MASKITQEEFLKTLWINNECYRLGNLEIISKYINSRTLIEVKDRYGVCKVSTNNLLKNINTSIVSAIDKNRYCVSQFVEAQGDKYNYTQVEYINAKTKVKVVCKEHGVFEQTPYAHLKGQGCYECVRYSRLDGRRLTTEKFIEESELVHKNKYSYLNVKVKGNKNKVSITCKEHGEFLQSPNSHLKGRGCKKCCLANNGYGRDKFTYFAKGNECTLYLLECFNEKESFLKIGITSKSIVERFSGDKKLPYNYSVIKGVKSYDSSYVWNEEVKIKRIFKEHSYTPLVKFRGYTECFKIEKKESIINYLNKL